MHTLISQKFCVMMVLSIQNVKEELEMAHKRVTMQDIADVCGLSRNTVSKIFNGKGAVPEATRRMVIQKARELGYHQFPDNLFDNSESVAQAPQIQNIALLTNKMPTDYHFGTFLLPVFTEQLSRAGYTLTLHEISEGELRQCRLPAHMVLEQTAGVLGLELFDKPYLDMLCGLRVPTIFIDAYAGAAMFHLDCDLISMENRSSMAEMTAYVIGAGAKKLGFVGDPKHCNSFWERWTSFCFALDRAGIALEKELCILADDFAPYDNAQWLAEQIRAMPAVPDAFVCANDFLALNMLSALKQMGLSVPGDVMLTGFDGVPQSAVIEPSLTTAQIPNTEIGRMAAEVLLDRIAHPDRPFRTIYIRTSTIWRGSTSR